MCVCVCVCVYWVTPFIYVVLLPYLYDDSRCEIFQFSMFCVKCASDLISVMYVSISKLFNILLFYVFLCWYEKKKHQRRW